MRLFKGFNKDMTCSPNGVKYQYEEGKTYHEDEASLCHTGFHACENPLDCFGYYHPGDGSVYHEVDLEDMTDEREDDSKRVGKTIKIGAALDVAGICRAHFQYVSERCNPVDGRVAGDNESVSVGIKAAASAGYRGSASAGYRGSASAGESGSASAGNYGSASAGYRGSASAGESGSAVSRGSSAVEANGVAVARGNGVKVKGGPGSILVIAVENSNNYDIKEWKAVVVDGETVKADTWYTIKNGKLVEVQDGE